MEWLHRSVAQRNRAREQRFYRRRREVADSSERTESFDNVTSGLSSVQRPRVKRVTPSRLGMVHKGISGNCLL